MKLLPLLGALLAAVTCAECVTVCYYGSWATYRPGNGKVDIEDIDPHMCTHLVYAFVGVDSEDGVITVLDPYADLCKADHEQGGLCGFQRFNALKNQNPDLKTLLAVGGWNEGSADFSIVASDQQKRKSFVDSALELLRAHNFDGLDMDWEYPGSRNGSSPEDKVNFITLLSELRSALSTEGMMLTAAVAAGHDTIDKGYDVPGMAENLDYIFLMAYDMFGPWDNFTHHNAPLYAHPNDTGNDTFTNVDYAVQYWLNLGTPAEKLVLGLGTYGRCWSLPSNTADPGFYTPAYEHGPPGPYTNEPGFFGYNELCEKQKNENWTILRDSDIDEAYAYHDDGKQIVWCGYDDEESIREKALYARSLGLGGVMAWSLETDDVHGLCNSDKFPLIKAADQVFHDKEAAEQDSVMSCYYENWAIYKPVNTLGVVEVEHLAELANVCTHLIYAFASILDTGEIQMSDVTADACPGDPGGETWYHCGYEKFNNLKQDNYNLKTLIAVGGQNSEKLFSKVAEDDTLRGKFVDSVVLFLEKYGFDGLDVDWEFPIGTDDKANLVKLLSELNTALHAKNLLLTIAVPVGISTIDKGYDVPNVSKYVDFIHVMAYDFHGTWANNTHHNAPLYKHSSDIDEQLNTDFAIHHWIDSGAPADKLVLGLPMYGRCWSLDDPNNHGIGAQGTVGPNGTYSRTPGQLYYSEICKRQMEFDWTIVRDPDMEVPYAYTSWDNTWCGYDDKDSIANKVMYAHNLGLRGVMAWAVDQDDAHNECASTKFPLTKKAKEVLDNPITTATPNTDPTTTLVVTTDAHGSEESVMSCYYENWAIYKPANTLGVVEVQDLDGLTDVCTHLIYAFASINSSTGEIKMSDPGADACPGDPGGETWYHCGYEKFNNFTQDHPDLKTLIAVGGMGSAGIFSKVVANETLRGNLVESVIQFLEKYDFDGLDVDWEFPESSDDKANLVKLLSELEIALHAKNLLLTIAVPVGIGKIDSGYDVPNVSKHVDFIHVMAYDFHGTWATTTHHNAPLYKHPTDIDEQLNTDFAIHYWLDSGAPANKLVLGLPMYGRCWSLDDPDDHGIGAPGTDGPNGTYSRDPGQLYYSEICKKQMEFKWTIERDPDMEVPYAYTSWNNTWCGYDDKYSIANKVRYAQTLGLRGVMVWAVDQDDAHNECTLSSFRDSPLSFPLTRKAKEVLDTPITTALSTTDPTTTPAETTVTSTTVRPTTDPTTTPAETTVTLSTVSSTTDPTTTPAETTLTSTSTIASTTSDITTVTSTDTTASPTTSDSTFTAGSTTSPATSTSDPPETTATTTTEVTETTSAALSPSPGRSLVTIVSASLLMLIITKLII